jgi:hypothetical protein
VKKAHPQLKILPISQRQMHHRPTSDSRMAGSDDCMLIVDTESLTWKSILMAIPLSEQVFIAGGAATWLTERATTGTDPEWIPGDIDVFVCQRDDMFVTIVNALLLCHIDISHAQVIRGNGIIDVQFTNRPHLSFIRCDVNVHARAVVSQFDIDICKPIVIQRNGEIILQMSGEILAGISDRCMHCTIDKKKPSTMAYPFAKTLSRLSKYQTRGYSLASMTFRSVINLDFPDLESWLHADDFRTLCDA